MGHYGTLVVAGLSDHTVKLSPLTIFNCTEVVLVILHDESHEFVWKRAESFQFPFQFDTDNPGAAARSNVSVTTGRKRPVL